MADRSENERGSSLLRGKTNRDSAARYEALVRAIPDLMFVLSRDGTYIDFKADLTEELALPPDEIIGKNIHDIGLPESDQQKILEAIERSLTTKTIQTVDYRLDFADGSRYYEARIAPLNESEVLSIVRNITDRIRAQRANDEHQAFLRQVIDINPNFVFAKDRKGRFTVVNKAVADNYGTTVEKLIGHTDSDFNPKAEQVEHFRKDDLEVIENKHEKVIPEEVITDSYGKVRWLSTVKRPLVDKDGQVNQVLGVAVDITRFKEAEAALKKTTEALRAERHTLAEKNAALREILDHLEGERQEYKERIAHQIEQALLPELRRLKRKVGTVTIKDLEVLEDSVKAIVEKDIDEFKDRLLSLSPREAEICRMIGDGKSSKQISDELNLSLVTVHKHREIIRKKLGITNMRVNLASYLRSRNHSERT